MKYIKFIVVLLAVLIAPKISALSLSTDNTLSSLSLSPGITLEPEFAPSTNVYSATTDAVSTVVNATVTVASRATIVSGTSSSEVSLAYGSNLFTIVVRSESGEDYTYTVNVFRNDNRSSNNNLRSLTINKGKLKFNQSITTYNINVDQSVTSITAVAELDDSRSRFEAGYGSPKTIDNLKLGSGNLIQFRILAENGSAKVYSININRNDERSSNNYLGSLSLNPGNIIFDKNTLEYYVTVANSVEMIDVIATAEDPNASISLSGGNNLAEGLNTMSVVVTPENGSQKRVYTITVSKLAKGVVLSSNNYLKSLVISDYTVKLSKNSLKYTALVNSDGPVDISPIADYSSATVTVTGNEDIKSGSVVTVSVIAENGSRRDYKITLLRNLSPAWFGVLIVIALISIAMAAIFIRRKMPKKAKTTDSSEKVDPEPINVPALNTDIHNDDIEKEKASDKKQQDKKAEGVDK